MTEEQLIQANSIRKEIDDIKAHKAKLESQIKVGAYQPWQHTRLILKWGSDNGEDLSSKFLLLPPKKIIQLYFDEIDKTIKELEEQFSKV